MSEDVNDQRFATLFEGSGSSTLSNHRSDLSENPPATDRVPVVSDGIPKPVESRKRRLPPGQSLTTKFPVLDLGERPLIDARDWRLTLAGLVEDRSPWDWRRFQEAAKAEIRADIHCVTAWSRFDNDWSGVAAADFLAVVRPKPAARFVVFHGADGYTTNVPLARIAESDALLAHSWQGEPLSREHGGPVRVVIPSLYFWKSTKWLRHIVFLENDIPGYWENRGYHNDGDPWREQRTK